MTDTVPAYELYGDLLAGRLPDPIHHETIRERSSQYDWTIRRHRHKRLAQVFLFRSPGVEFFLGDIAHRSTQPMVLVVAPDVPHGFVFPEDVVGDVLSVRLADVSPSIRSRFKQFDSVTDPVFIQDQTRNFVDMVDLVRQVRVAYHSIADNRAEVLMALIDLLMLYLVGNLRKATVIHRPSSNRSAGRKDAYAEAFCTILEDQFSKGWSVPDYARKLGISAPHLTRICRSILGAPPNDLVRQRRILEAKRLLEYTGLPVSEIAHRSGFRDPAFFSRTFKASVGVPPHHYRLGLVDGAAPSE